MGGAGPPLANGSHVRHAAAFVLAGLVTLTAVPAAHAGSGGIVPPMRIDVGPAVSHVDDVPMLQVVAGLHWASVYPKGLAGFDVGVGFVSETSGDDDATAPTSGTARTVGTAPRPSFDLVGGYVEVAARTAGNGWWRTWVGTRVESGRAELGPRGGAYVGVATRVSTEAYLAGASSDHRSAVLGVFAIGLYGELSARRIEELGDDLGASVGVTMRVPLIVAD